jgi:hypothetical protein
MKNISKEPLIPRKPVFIMGGALLLLSMGCSQIITIAVYTKMMTPEHFLLGTDICIWGILLGFITLTIDMLIEGEKENE